MESQDGTSPKGHELLLETRLRVPAGSKDHQGKEEQLVETELEFLRIVKYLLSVYTHYFLTEAMWFPLVLKIF